MCTLIFPLVSIKVSDLNLDVVGCLSDNLEFTDPQRLKRLLCYSPLPREAEVYLLDVSKCKPRAKSGLG